MYAPPAAPPAAWAELVPGPPWWRVVLARVLTFCWVEWSKIRHDRTELYTRAIQPALWLLVFGRRPS
jgi:ABC-2 type transport system permease protein